MKKTLLLALAILLSVAIKAQDVLINESFDSTDMPEGWTVMGEALTNWKSATPIWREAQPMKLS